MAVGASSRSRLWPPAPGSTASGRLTNRARAASSIFVCKGASTLARIAWYKPFSDGRAASIDTPGFSRPNRYTQYERRAA
jgi:hypothetical protein